MMLRNVELTLIYLKNLDSRGQHSVHNVEDMTKSKELSGTDGDKVVQLWQVNAHEPRSNSSRCADTQQFHAVRAKGHGRLFYLWPVDRVLLGPKIKMLYYKCHK